ncbi:MAG TPA: hypothetical protein VKO67_12145, partial [Smithellaceae bacterium]|nr:hypothetical protein [Smithellaceae bacterium]
METLRRDRQNKQNLLFARPVDVITCRRKKDVAASFQKMEKYLEEGFYLAGFFSYELGYTLEETFGKSDSSLSRPLLWFGVFGKPLRQAASL